MKTSISSWSYRSWFDEGRCDLLSFVDEVRRVGADAFEVFPKHVDSDDPGGHLKQVVEKATALGLEISSMIAANDFARPRVAERAVQVARTMEWIGHAAEAGIDKLNTFTGYHASGHDPMMEIYRVIDGYREVMPVAEEKGVLLCIENHSSVARDADTLLQIIHAVGSPNLRTNPDFTNFVGGYRQLDEKSREAIYVETLKVAPLAANAHLKIGDFTEDGGHAFVDVQRLVEIMRDADYDGHVVLETYRPETPDELCAKGIELLRKCFQG
jgi:sugar phosphate isomerase/epimerase